MRQLLLATTLALAAVAAPAAEQVRTVGPFDSVYNSGPISIEIQVGKAQSITASGSDEFLQRLETEVSGHELRVHLAHGSDSLHGKAHIVITMPALVRYEMSGAGDSTLTGVHGDALDISVSGAGSLKADGSVKALRLTLGGVGSVDTRELHAQDVHASVGGVGSVKVWASDTLDASVGGVGSLTYYGDPKTVNTSSGGIGSVSRGK